MNFDNKVVKLWYNHCNHRDFWVNPIIDNLNKNHMPNFLRQSSKMIVNSC